MFLKFILAPTASPRNFTAIANDSSSLQLNWLEPDASQTNGIVRNYNVLYQEVNCADGTTIGNGSSWNKVSVEADARSTVITNLLFWSCYDVKIAAFTVGQGPFAKAEKVRTSEHGKEVLVYKKCLLLFVFEEHDHLKKKQNILLISCFSTCE